MSVTTAELTTTTEALATMTIADAGPAVMTTTTTMTTAAAAVATTAALGSIPAAAVLDWAAPAEALDPAVPVSVDGLPKGAIPKKREEKKKGKAVVKEKMLGGGGAAPGRAERWGDLNPDQVHLVRARCRLVSFHWMPHPTLPRLAVARVVMPEGADLHFVIEDAGDLRKVKEGFGSAFEFRSPMFFTEDARLREVLERWMSERGTKVLGWCLFDGESALPPVWPTLGLGTPMCPSATVARFRKWVTGYEKEVMGHVLTVEEMVSGLAGIDRAELMARRWSPEKMHPERGVVCPAWFWGAQPCEGGDWVVREGMFGVPDGEGGAEVVEDDGSDDGSVQEVEVGDVCVMDLGAAPGEVASTSAAAAVPDVLPPAGQPSVGPPAGAGKKRRWRKRGRGTSSERREREASNQRRHEDKVRRREEEEDRQRQAAVVREEKRAREEERQRQEAVARQGREEKRQREVAEEGRRREEARRQEEARKREEDRRWEEGRRRWLQREDERKAREERNRRKFEVFDARRKLNAAEAALGEQEALLAARSGALVGAVAAPPAARGSFRGGVGRGRGAVFRGRPQSASRAAVPVPRAADPRLSVSAAAAPAAGPDGVQQQLSQLVGVMTSFVAAVGSLAPARVVSGPGGAVAGGGRGEGPVASSSPVLPPRSRPSRAAQPPTQFLAADFRVAEGLVPAVVSRVESDGAEDDARMQ